MEEKTSDKTRRERRKEARMVKNKKKFDSWVQHQQSKLPTLDLKLENKRKLLKNNGISDCTEQTEVAEKSESKLRDLIICGAREEPRTLRNSGIKKELKQKNSLNRTPNSNFLKLLQLETEGRAVSAEEDLRFERRLAKKLKVKSGNLSAANDDIDMLLEGIPSVLDNISDIGEVHKSSQNGTLSWGSKTIDSGNEYLEDGNSDEEGNKESDNTLDSSEEHEDVLEVISSEDSNKRKRSKTKFEEYLETDIEGVKGSADADLALERKLAKKLKVKSGKVWGDDEGINMLLEGVPSVLDSLENESLQSPSHCPKKSLDDSIPYEKIDCSNLAELKRKGDTRIGSNVEACGPSDTLTSEVALENFPNKGPGKYVAPHLRSSGGNESAEFAQVRKRVRGLLNRLSETNVESITGENSALFHSVGRSVGSRIITEEVVASCSGGPRGNEQYAAVFAAFVAGMACLVGIDFGAKVLARLAKCFEDEYLKEDNLSLRNLTLLLSYLYVFGVCCSELVYDFLIMLGKQLTEVDVSTVLTLLQCCGMKLRGDDPVGMKNFILSIQSRVNELKASSENGRSNISSKRMEFMLETICDIKNNKKRSKEDTVQHTRIKKWLQKEYELSPNYCYLSDDYLFFPFSRLHITFTPYDVLQSQAQDASQDHADFVIMHLLKVDNILIRGLKWGKLLDPNKKGQWWLSGDIASTPEHVEEVSSTIDKEIPETKKMLQLAASQRMNTDARRAIFCVIMSGEDYLDAFEKLLRLDLQGKQDREIMRVLVECCLQEKVFNRYYCVLASKLCSHDKNHKFTLQYCLWDHFKELESMPLIRTMHLSKFIAEMVGSFSLSLAVLKAVELSDPIHITPKRIMHFRMLFEAIFEFPDKLVWNIFTRIAATPEYESLRSGIEFFTSKYIAGGQKNKFKIAKKALNNIEGVVM